MRFNDEHEEDVADEMWGYDSKANNEDIPLSAADFDGSNWNLEKKNDCYFKGLNNLVSDGLLHLDDGMAVDCESGKKVNPVDFGP